MTKSRRMRKAGHIAKTDEIISTYIQTFGRKTSSKDTASKTGLNGIIGYVY
jgi:hypothetical protein